MLKFEKDDLLYLLEKRGFRAVNMKTPIGIPNHPETRAVSRRCFELKKLLGELDSLWKYNVRTIGVYSVMPTGIYLDPMLMRSRDSGGVAIRWAYYADGIGFSEEEKDIAYHRSLMFASLGIPKGYLNLSE